MTVKTMQRDSAPSGMVSATGGPVEKIVRNTANETESARGGKGKDSQLTDAETQMRDHIARDQEYRRTHGNMAGWRFAADTEATRASRQQLHDAYAEYETRLTSSWRSLDAEYVASPSAEPNVGAGSPSRNFGKQHPGDQCMTDDTHEPGHLDENLVCVADSKRDSRTVTDIARDHAIRMDQEIRDCENSISSAYKTLK